MARSSMLFIMFLLQVALNASCVQAAVNNILPANDSIFDSANRTNFFGYVLAVVAILVGGGMIVFGYRFMFETVFAISFALGAIGIGVTAERLLVGESFWAVGSWVAFILGGVVCGGMAMWVHPKSNFMAGVAGGITLAMIVTNSVAYCISPGHTQQVFTILCVVFAVVFATFDLKCGKPVDIIGISTFGAAILVWGVGFFAGDFPFPNNLEKYSTKNANGNMVYIIPTIWWGYLAGIVMISAFGMFIQFHKTGRSPVDDALADFGANGFEISIDALPYVENDKQRPTVPMMNQSGNTTRESDFLPSSYPSVVHQSFCRLYSRNTEAQSIKKLRSNFFEERAQSVETENTLNARESLPSSQTNSFQEVKKEVEF
ncbi:unnamed protein product [Peronospora belbahrii]|uniref:Transmembrane protein 198 n=1 Tax=Peronospora belbahrii TaxID=622444 RepID=A0AAU9LA43_9STRA|nr:unnamed protein product [Peronospora belbahrii]